MQQGLLPSRLICYLSTHLPHRCMIKQWANLTSAFRISCFTSSILHLFKCFLMIISPTHLSHRLSRHPSLTSSCTSFLFISPPSLTSALICSGLVSLVSSGVCHLNRLYHFHHHLHHHLSQHKNSKNIASPSPLLFIACYDLNSSTTTLSLPPIPNFDAPFLRMSCSVPSPLCIFSSTPYVCWGEGGKSTPYVCVVGAGGNPPPMYAQGGWKSTPAGGFPPPSVILWCRSSPHYTTFQCKRKNSMILMDFNGWIMITYFK